MLKLTPDNHVPKLPLGGFFYVCVLLVLTGCAAIPTMKYCDKVEYKREGTKIHIQAECTAPVGSSLPGI